MKSGVVAIDGLAYTGKSQIAKALSRLTGFAYINTGHMYRALAKLALENGVPVDNETELVGILKGAAIRFVPLQGAWRTMVGGEDWTDRLDDPEIVLLSSKIAVLAEIRGILTEIQRGYAAAQAIIMEGRDIGSVVFPNARWKFFITASLEIRAKRMLKMVSKEEGGDQDETGLICKLKEIDETDKTRKISPLIEAPDAFIYDNTESPSAEEDALVLKHYLDQYDPYAREGGQVKFTYQEGMAEIGKYIRA